MVGISSVSLDSLVLLYENNPVIFYFDKCLCNCEEYNYIKLY